MTTEIRPAATVLLLRDGVAGLEVFMVQRPLDAAFMPGALVFPGGAIDADDGALDGHEPFCPAIRRAAIRELFEETGFLVARARADGAPVEAEIAATLAERWRAPLNAGQARFSQMLDEAGLDADIAALVPVARWVTPPGRSRRFDARFFLVAAPEGQAGAHDGSELIHSLWLTPAAALAEEPGAKPRLALPTRTQLTELARSADVAAALDAGRHGPIPVYTPTMSGAGSDRSIGLIDPATGRTVDIPASSVAD